MTRADLYGPVDCPVCGRAIVEGWNIHGACRAATKYAEAIMVSELAHDLCEFDDGNMETLRSMLVAAYFAGAGRGGMTS